MSKLAAIITETTKTETLIGWGKNFLKNEKLQKKNLNNEKEHL